jgi:hypothetical protein
VARPARPPPRRSRACRCAAWSTAARCLAPTSAADCSCSSAAP